MATINLESFLKEVGKKAGVEFKPFGMGVFKTEVSVGKGRFQGISVQDRKSVV